MLKFVKTTAAMKEIGKEAQKGLITSLDNSGANATKKLRNSIKYFVDSDGRGVVVKGDRHWRAVEGEKWVGDKGKDFYKSILEWVQTGKVNIDSKVFGTGKKGQRNFAFVVMRNISKKGTKTLPKPFVKPFLDSGFERKARAKVTEAYTQDITDMIKEKLK